MCHLRPRENLKIFAPTLTALPRAQTAAEKHLPVGYVRQLALRSTCQERKELSGALQVGTLTWTESFFPPHTRKQRAQKDPVTHYTETRGEGVASVHVCVCCRLAMCVRVRLCVHVSMCMGMGSACIRVHAWLCVWLCARVLVCVRAPHGHPKVCKETPRDTASRNRCRIPPGTRSVTLAQRSEFVRQIGSEKVQSTGATPSSTDLSSRGLKLPLGARSPDSLQARQVPP